MSNQQSKRGRYKYDDIETEPPDKKLRYSQASTGVVPWKEHASGQPSGDTQSVYSTYTLNSLPIISTAPTKSHFYHGNNNSAPGGIPSTFSWWETPLSSMAIPKATLSEYSHCGTYPFACEIPMSNEIHMRADIIPLQTAQDSKYIAPFYQTFSTPQALPGVPYTAPASEFESFSPCESPEPAVFQSPTVLSSPTDIYFRNTAVLTDFPTTSSIVATQDYTQKRPSHCLATRMLGPVEWSLGLDCFVNLSNGGLHSCLPQVSAILGKLKERRETAEGSSPTREQDTKVEAGVLRETIAMNRESTEHMTRILSCGCLSKDANLTRFIITTVFEIITHYSRIARGIVGDQIRAEGQVRARVGMILGELPNISHFIDLLANRWYQAHRASDPMMAAQDMLSKQDENSLSPLAFSHHGGKLRQRLQAVTHEIMRYCGRA